MWRDQLTVTTTKKHEVVDITLFLNSLLERRQVGSGMLFLFLPHTTAGLTTAALDPARDLDILTDIELAVPKAITALQRFARLPGYVVAAFLGPSLQLPVEGGRLLLGTYQRIIIVELNGPHDRAVQIQYWES